jgi:hypothetical protein
MATVMERQITIKDANLFRYRLGERPTFFLARYLSTSLPTVLLWNLCNERDGLAGVIEDRLGSPRPKQTTPVREAAIVDAMIETTPKDVTHCSVPCHGRESEGPPGRGAAELEEAQAAAASGRVFQLQRRSGLRSEGAPYRWLYLKPPDRAIVLSLHEKIRFNRWTGRGQFVPYSPGCQSAKRTTMSGMERWRYLPP